MNNNLLDALENSLRMMQEGSDLESCLVRYPELADELRPLLLASLDANSVADSEIPAEVIKRSKAKFLNAAAELREQKIVRKTFFAFPMRRTFQLSFAALLVILFLAGAGGTGLVSASSGSLPGDRLYSVKLTWENIQLKLAVNQAEKESLVDRFDQERVVEVNTLIKSQRQQKVEFSGQVEGMFPGQIIVAGVKVEVTPDTRVEGAVQLGVWARVKGLTQANGAVVAEQIQFLPTQPSGNSGQGNEDHPNPNSGDQNSGEGDKGSSGKKQGKTDAPEDTQVATPEPATSNSPSESNSGQNKGESTPEVLSFEVQGKVDSFNSSVIQMMGKTILIAATTEIKGNLTPGSFVEVKGYSDPSGNLIALRIEVKSTSNSGGGGNHEGGGESGGISSTEPSRTPEPSKTPED
jgi:hypothetical protein